MRGAIAMLLAAAACAQKRAPQTPVDKPPVEVAASVDRAVVTAGDRIMYEIVVEHERGIEVELPEPARELGGFRIVDLGTDPPVVRENRERLRRWYLLVGDVVGSYVLPALEVRANVADALGVAQPRTYTASQIFVEVKSVLPKDGEVQDIRDIKPITKPAFRWLWPAVGALAVLLAAAGLVLWLALRKRAMAVPPAPAHEVAFAALEALRHADFNDPEQVRRWHFAVSEIVRAYVEARLGINATDLTSEEIMARLDEAPELGPALRLELRAILYDTDRVKFAGHAAGEPEIRATHERALRFVEETMPRPAAQEAA
ncbi:MAG: hypothetical protein HYZ27_09825 [Deltaproteobacteria bacterium]|nr:hypothetical protein [Deltaproteobacteria bacterium]